MSNTTQRDELLRLHTPLTMDAQKQPEYRNNTESALYGYSEGVEHTLDTVWAKGYRKPRTITTVEELDALPKGTTILDAGGMGAQWDGEMWSGEGRWWHSTQIAFPATVLYEPEAEATNIDFALATAAAVGVPLTEEQVREHIANNQQSEAESTR